MVFGSDDKMNFGNLYIISKDGMTTREFFRIARTLDYDRDVMLNHSLAFSNVSTTGFDEHAETLVLEAFNAG